MKNHHKFIERKVSVFAVALLFAFSPELLCFAAENDLAQYVPLSSSYKNGELHTVAKKCDYKEFEIKDSSEDIVFLSDYRPINLLSNKEILSKTSFLNSSKIVYNIEHPQKHWELVKAIY